MNDALREAVTHLLETAESLCLVDGRRRAYLSEHDGNSYLIFKALVEEAEIGLRRPDTEGPHLFNPGQSMREAVLSLALSTFGYVYPFPEVPPRMDEEGQAMAVIFVVAKRSVPALMNDAEGSLERFAEQEWKGEEEPWWPT